MTQHGAADDAGKLRTARAALSELFLDRDIDDGDRRHLCESLAATGLTLEALDRVFFDELEPVLSGNLRTPAGEWAGFDIEWLEARIRERGTSGGGWRRLVERGLAAIGTSAARDEWMRLREMLSAQGRTTS